jgi:hypothetical protein
VQRQAVLPFPAGLQGDLAHHRLGLGRLVFEAQEARRLPAHAKGSQHLGVAGAVVGDERVGERQDGLPRSVVHLQTDHQGLGPILGEVEDVLHLRAAPAVDRLVVVAHYAQVAVTKRERLDDPILRGIGVLIFVDHHLVEARSFDIAYVRELGEQALGTEQ